MGAILFGGHQAQALPHPRLELGHENLNHPMPLSLSLSLDLGLATDRCPGRAPHDARSATRRASNGTAGNARPRRSLVSYRLPYGETADTGRGECQLVASVILSGSIVIGLLTSTRADSDLPAVMLRADELALAVARMELARVGSSCRCRHSRHSYRRPVSALVPAQASRAGPAPRTGAADCRMGWAR